MLVSHSLITGPGQLFVGLYQASSQTMTSLACGGSAALIRRAGTGQVETLAQAGPLLGTDTATIYRQQAIQLNIGDMMFFSPGSGTAFEDEADVSRWKEALAFPLPAADAQQWLLHLVQTGQKDARFHHNGSLCLLAAQVIKVWSAT